LKHGLPGVLSNWNKDARHTEEKKDGWKILKRTYRKEEVIFARQWKQEAVADLHPCSPIVDNLLVKTGGPKEEKKIKYWLMCISDPLEARKY